MKQFMNPVTNCIFIMLGPRCNLQCRYCLQTPAVDKSAPTTAINPEIYEFLWDMASNQDNPLKVHFFGGEPTVYRKEMTTMVEHLQTDARSKTMHFSMISNGVAITPDFADWINTHAMAVALSWDGPMSTVTRGVDVLADAGRKRAILSIHNLSISAVLSSYAYPLELMDAYIELDKEYWNLHEENIFLNIDEIMDTGIADRSLLEIDYDRVYNESSIIAAEYEKSLRGEEANPWYANMGAAYVANLKSVVHNTHSFEKGQARCGTGLSMMNMDLQGNLYFCHNVPTVLGTINDTFASYINQLMLNDPTRENSRICKDCPVVSICNTGCPLIGKKEREETYCKLKRAMYQPFVDLVISMGQE